MTTELTTRPLDVQLVDDPQAIALRTQKAAEVLMQFVRAKGLAKKFGGQSEHIFNPAWQFLAHMYGLALSSPEVHSETDERSGQFGFRARAEARIIATGQVIAEAWASCFSDEENWGDRNKYEVKNGTRTQIGTVRVPSFQLQSMAQTRAQSKVAKSVLGFVVVMAGFDPTPAEEMTGTEHQNGHAEAKPEGPKRISEPQCKRIFAIRAASKMPTDELAKLLKEFGFNIAADVTVDKYQEFCSRVENWGK